MKIEKLPAKGWSRSAGKIVKNLFLDLLFPSTCIGCRQKDTWLCTTCFDLIKAKKTQHCYLCGKESFQGKTCERHFKKKPLRTLDGLLVCCHYSGNPILKKAIKTLKYQRRTENIAEKLGQLLSITLNPFLRTHNVPNVLNGPHVPNVPILIPIPLHPTRLKQRGFNQSELLAQSAFNQQFLPTEAQRAKEGAINNQQLMRIKNTSPQAQTTSRKERQKNLNNAFSISEPIRPNTTYILIDDVSTTGATLEECCTVLKQNGAKQVWGIVLARN